MTIQVKRQDLVRIAAERLREQIADEIRDATAAELAARGAFTTAMMGMATAQWNGTLSDVCRLVGTERPLRVDVLLEMTDDNVANPPEMVGVVIRDGSEWDSRLSLRCELPADRPALLAWVAAIRRKQAAEERGTRAKDLDAAARAKMIDDLLTTHATGRAVLSVLAQFVAEMKQPAGEDMGA